MIARSKALSTVTKARAGSGWAERWGVDRLVYFDTFGAVTDAIASEKQLKGWNRAWKIRLIETSNPEWRDLESMT